MSSIEIFLIALGLSMDCFAVSISMGAANKIIRRDAIRMSLWFGLFQGAMPLFGWIIGGFFREVAQSVDHWVAFGILSFIGLRMVAQVFRKEEDKKAPDIRKFSVLLSLSIATSIDALITGFSFGLITVNIFKASAIITVTTFLVSGIGAKVGERAHHISPKHAELIGGIVLILIGTKILLDHLSIY
jgi:manganese efflux pump family protein